MMAHKLLHQFQLIQAQNGGWMVYLPGPMDSMPEIVAAYSNTADALAGLARLMANDPTTYPPHPLASRRGCHTGGMTNDETG